MNYNDEIISFFTTTLSGWDVTGYHSRSLFIIKNRHNFGHNFHTGHFVWPDWIKSGKTIISLLVQPGQRRLNLAAVIVSSLDAAEQSEKSDPGILPGVLSDYRHFCEIFADLFGKAHIVV